MTSVVRRARSAQNAIKNRRTAVASTPVSSSLSSTTNSWTNGRTRCTYAREDPGTNPRSISRYRPKRHRSSSTGPSGADALAAGSASRPRRYASSESNARADSKCEYPAARRAAKKRLTTIGDSAAAPSPSASSHLLTCAIKHICACADPGVYPRADSSTTNPSANGASGPLTTVRDGSFFTATSWSVTIVHIATNLGMPAQTMKTSAPAISLFAGSSYRRFA